jgi:hypothetical protein
LGGAEQVLYAFPGGPGRRGVLARVVEQPEITATGVVVKVVTASTSTGTASHQALDVTASSSTRTSGAIPHDR